MSGIIAVYSLVISVLIAGDMDPPSRQSYSLFKYVSDFAQPNEQIHTILISSIVVSCISGAESPSE